MVMLDKIVLTLMTLSFLGVTHFFSYEYGKREMCMKNKDYLWSFDLGVCLKVGHENVYGNLK
jgi:hypothetical protein